jgi:signal transduction histidine kinase/Na+/proline symporter
MQFKRAGLIFEYALELPGVYGIISAAVIVTLYSSLGGIKSVTFTDIIQFITFGTVIPLMAYVLFNNLDNLNAVTNIIANDSMFDYKEVFDFLNPKSLYYLFISLFFIIPAFNPAIFQRIAMARSVQQVSNSFIISAITCLLLVLIVSWIGVLMLAIHPNIASNDIIRYIVSDYSFITGYRGIVLAGIMAMIMSTVDSFINSSAVILTHDIFKTLKVRFIKNELFTARIVSLWIGIFSLMLSLRDNSLLELIIVTYSLYMPIVTVPFIMAILGFRSTEKSVLIGMSAGLLTVITWDYLLQIKSVNSVPLGMLANLVSLMGSHYLLKQKGGWIGIKDYSPVIAIQNERKKRAIRFLHSIKNFNILDICKKNCPRGDGLTSILGIFIMISLSVSTHTLPKEYQIHYKHFIDTIYPAILFSSTVLISYPLWLKKWKEIDLIAVVWNLIIFSVVICFSFFMVLISDFAEIQLMAFMVNIIMLSAIISWRWALFTITLGVTATSIYYQQLIPIDLATSSLSSQFKIAYLLLLIISILIAFLKPKQDYLEATEHKVEVLEAEVTHLDHEVIGLNSKVTGLNSQVTDLNEQVTHFSQRAADQEKEIDRLGATAQKILNNVSHELRLPIGNVVNFSEMLQETLEKSDNKLVKELAKEVYDNSNRVSTMILNMLDLATLDVKKVNLQKKTINFGELVEDRVKRCRKIYLRDKKINFELIIEPEVMIAVDPNYIRQTVDNLVINAINFSMEGLIKVSVSRKDRQVIFIITDQGKGIPKNELSDIFNPFKMGSNSESKACGRGVGLALCKSAVEAHGGSITADSNGEVGATLRFVLPL